MSETGLGVGKRRQMHPNIGKHTVLAFAGGRLRVLEGDRGSQYGASAR